MSDQTYLGNGKHFWESVIEGQELGELGDTFVTNDVDRLRVPGGWLYQTRTTHYSEDAVFNRVNNLVFVPMPEVVKHKV